MSMNDSVRRLVIERRRPGSFTTRDIADLLAAIYPGYDSTYYRAKAYAALRDMESDGLVRSELSATYRAPNHRVWTVIL